MKLTFRKCTLAKLDKLFGLDELSNMPLLEEWLSKESAIEISAFERESIVYLRQKLIENVRHWNEAELSIGFIGPLVTLADFSERKFNFFSQRSLQGFIGDIELAGEPDGMIASGRRAPEKPYFCFHEYKREEDPDGDPAGQVLGAMLLAQALNEDQHPIYGCYVKGSVWYFLVLQGKEYGISLGYVATRDDVFLIFRVLRILKQVIQGYTNQST